jgi:DNA recombination protein RmuC
MNDLPHLLATPALGLGSTAVTFGQLLAALALIALLVIAALAVALWRASNARALAALEAAMHARDTEARMASLLQAQAEMQGRMGRAHPRDRGAT